MDLHAYTKLKEWHTRDGFVTLVGVLTLSVSSLVMLGWWWGLRPLLSILPAGPIMKFNTALLFFALGSALLSFRSARRPLRLAHHLAIVLIVAISLMNLVEYAFAVDLRQPYLAGVSLWMQSYDLVFPYGGSNGLEMRCLP